MKKLLACFLLFCLFVPPCFADKENEQQYVGTWIHENFDEETGRYSVILLKLTDDYDAYYSAFTFSDGKPALNRQAQKTWCVKGRGIHIIIGENTDTDAVILSDGRLGFVLSGNAYTPFVRISGNAEEKKKETGVYVPGGYWEVGVDIPAGVYSVRRVESISSQNFVVYDAYNPESGRYTRTIINTILNSRNPQIGKFTLYEGNIVWVDEGVYFDAPITLGF